MSTLHPPRLSYEQAACECAAVLEALRQVESAHPQRDGEMLENWRGRLMPARLQAAAEHIHRYVWQAPRVGMIAVEYPDAKRDSTDAWARAGTAHAMLDAIAGFPARSLDPAIPEQKQAVYSAAYLQARRLMIGVST